MTVKGEPARRAPNCAVIRPTQNESQGVTATMSLWAPLAADFGGAGSLSNRILPGVESLRSRRRLTKAGPPDGTGDSLTPRMSTERRVWVRLGETRHP